jgi:hypothetical protein
MRRYVPRLAGGGTLGQRHSVCESVNDKQRWENDDAETVSLVPGQHCGDRTRLVVLRDLSAVHHTSRDLIASPAFIVIKAAEAFKRCLAWPRHPGRAARLIENRECPKPATRDCERTTLIQLAWLWLRNQPRSALSVWFHQRVSHNGGRLFGRPLSYQGHCFREHLGG